MDQTANLVVITRVVAKTLVDVQTSEGKDAEKPIRQYEALLNEGFKQIRSGIGG